VTRTPLSRSKGQRSRSPGRFTQHGLNARLQRSAWERTYSAWESNTTVRLLGGARRGRRGAGHIVSPRAQLVRISF